MVIDFAETIHATKLINMVDIKAIDVDWLWYPYIPVGKVTNMVGDPGEGKSHASLAIATSITLGTPILPGLPAVGPGNILIASAEDGLNDTLRPRLDRLHAVVNRIFVIDGLFTFDETGTARLENYINQVNPILTIIDPLTAYMGEKFSSNQSSHVRLIMSRLAGLADQYNTAIITIRHLNKNSANTKAIYRDAGSIDFSGAARSVLLVGTNPETEERAIVHIKSNLAPKGKSISFELTDTFYWKGESEITDRDILLAESSKRAIDEAEEFLQEILSYGPIKADEIIAESVKREIKDRTLKRAKSNLGVVSYRKAEKGKRGSGVWYWKLPDIKDAKKNEGE